VQFLQWFRASSGLYESSKNQVPCLINPGCNDPIVELILALVSLPRQLIALDDLLTGKAERMFDLIASAISRLNFPVQQRGELLNSLFERLNPGHFNRVQH